MRVDKYKKIRPLFWFLLVASIFVLFTDIDNRWAVVFIVILFLIGVNAIDKRQKEYLDERIDKLEKRIDSHSKISK